jgi:hypothetical protein
MYKSLIILDKVLLNNSPLQKLCRDTRNEIQAEYRMISFVYKLLRFWTHDHLIEAWAADEL